MPNAHHIVLADEPPTDELFERLDAALERIDVEHEVFFGDPQTEELDGVVMHAFADLSEGGHTLTLVEDPPRGATLPSRVRRPRASPGSSPTSCRRKPRRPSSHARRRVTARATSSALRSPKASRHRPRPSA